MDYGVKKEPISEFKTIRKEVGRLSIDSNDINVNNRVIEALLKAGYELDSKDKHDNNHYIVGQELIIYAKVTFYI